MVGKILKCPKCLTYVKIKMYFNDTRCLNCGVKLQLKIKNGGKLIISWMLLIPFVPLLEIPVIEEILINFLLAILFFIILRCEFFYAESDEQTLQ